MSDQDAAVHSAQTTDTWTLPRRKLLCGGAGSLGLAAFMTVSAAKAADGEEGEAPSLPIVPVRTVRQLAHIQTATHLAYAEGLERPEDSGGGLFVWRPQTEDAVPDDGHVHVADATGRGGYWVRADYDGASVRPGWFGPLEAGADHARTIQRAITFVSDVRGGQVDLGSRTYSCRSRIELDPTLCALTASGAVLDFSQRKDVQTRDIVALTGLVAVAAGSWMKRDERLHHVGAETEELTLPLQVQPGKRCRMEVDLALLQGDPNNPFLRIQISPEGQEAPLFKWVLSAAGIYAFEFDAPDAPCRLRLSCNSDAAIEDFRLTQSDPRECLLIRCREDGAQYGHRWITGLRLRGPGTAGVDNGLEGIRFQTTIDSRASRLAMRDVMVEGFGTALVLADRCYLAQFDSCRFVGEIGVHVLGGTEDAGENISFFGCAIGAGRIGIWNGGAELNLFGTSVNFCDQFYVGAGKVHASGCHFETGRLLCKDQLLFDIGAGLVTIEGGTMMVSGRDFEDGNQADHIVLCRSRLATFRLTRASCYNLRTATGIFGSGDGKVILQDIAGDARKFIAPIVTRDPASNLFGPTAAFEDLANLPIRLVGRDEVEQRDCLSRHSEAGVVALTPGTGNGGDAACWLIARALPGMRLSWSLDLRLERTVTTIGERPPTDDLLLDILFCDPSQTSGNGEPLSYVVAKKPLPIAASDLVEWRTLAGSTLDTREDEWRDGTVPAFATHIAIRLNLKNLQPGDQLLLRSPFAAAV
ncbi:hypothetical protein ACFOEZ_00640 [Tianweitania populi]|uniref:Uncharacterized protein n=1 Tax=Tianweitania populi TaxID=1607949 RepID=A0A8J3DZ08_9HYPH|nr:hypothetical protein [Tianweitania populi]GHD21929.1 hypothetical protein GCM10016234_35730 [Tianweitania populi]